MINLKQIIDSFIDKYKEDKYKVNYFTNFKSEKNFISLVNHYGVDIDNINVEKFLLNDLNNRLLYKSNGYIESTCGCCKRLIKYSKYVSFLKSINKNNCKHDAIANKVQMYIDNGVDTKESIKKMSIMFGKNIS